MMIRTGDALRPRGRNGALRLKIQTLTEAIERKDAELVTLRELAHAVLRRDNAEIDRLRHDVEAALQTQDPGKRRYRSFTPEFKIEICRQYRAAQKVHGGVAALLRKYDLEVGNVARWAEQFAVHGQASFYDKRLRAAQKKRGGGARAFEEEELRLLRKKVGLTLRPTCASKRMSMQAPAPESLPTEAERMASDTDRQRQEAGKEQQGTVSAELLSLLQGGDLP